MTKSFLPLLVLHIGAAAAVAGSFTFHHENVLGTSFELRVEAGNEAGADAAEARALAETDRLAMVLNTWRRDSEINRWLSGDRGPVAVSPDLLAVLRACDHWESVTGGAFNARAALLSGIWKRVAAEGSTPDAAELAAAVVRMKSPAWRIAEGTAERIGDCPVTVDALAKGYIISRAGEAARGVPGVTSVLLNIGGDLQIWGREAHRIAIANPRADAENAPPLTQVMLRSQGLATSGSYRRGTESAGRHHSHIYDPHTGQPADAILSASVIAPDAVTADALATAFSVMAPDDSVRLADRLEGVACFLVAENRIVRSRNWPDAPESGFVQAAAPPAAAPGLPDKKDASPDKNEAAPAKDAAAWGQTHELLVSYEINAPGGGRVHRPFVAVWIEDKDGYPVRTLALLMQAGKGMRWLPDLKRWHRSDRLRQVAEGTELAPSISAATRNPGAYSVVWDGTDNAKAPVAPGTYTLYLEAAREHGTYQLIKKEITVGGAPFQEKLAGNVEIKSAALDYRPKAAQ